MNDNLTKKVEVIGSWFLPNSNKKIPGVFRYSNGQSTLELLHFFPMTEQMEFPITYKTIHGETKIGKVTLTDVIFNHSYSRGHVYTAIFGQLLDDKHMIKEMTFNFDLLNDWAISKFPYTIWKDQEFPNTLETYEFTNEDITCKLSIQLGQSITYFKEAKTYNLSNLILIANNPKTIHIFLDYVFGIQYFLMLVMGRNLNLIDMKNQLKSHSHPIFLPVDKKEIEGSTRDHFFNISYIRENYTKILSNWFKFYKENKYLLKIFFTTMDDTTISTLDFYVYASLLEGYYKSQHNDKTDYHHRISIVLESFSKDFSNFNDFINKITEMRHNTFHFNIRTNLDEDILSDITHDLFFFNQNYFSKTYWY